MIYRGIHGDGLIRAYVVVCLRVCLRTMRVVEPASPRFLFIFGFKLSKTCKI